MSVFEIKKALPQDIAWIAQAQVLMANETENLQLIPEEVVTGVSFIFEHPDRGFYIIAKNDETDPVGCLLILKEWSDWRNGDVWWIHSVYVASDYRKHGIFRLMFDYAEGLARKSQVRGLRLYVDKSNSNAQRVYEKLGMNKEHYELFEKMF
ncbi:MAG: GNAT family N-acetyltransferase [bacterium]|nr:GNAT family N-acetyltransferase [bacterium]